MEEIYNTTASTGFRDPSSILEQINPEVIIQKIADDWHGIVRKTVRDGARTKTVVTRMHKPLFTDECIQYLISDLKQQLNFTVQVSRFDEERILVRIGTYRRALARYLATHGDDHYISEHSWKTIVDIHNSEGSWEKQGFTWEFNDPVKHEMLSLVKDESEEVDQAIHFEKIITSLSTLLEASIRKSYAGHQHEGGMLLAALQEIKKETAVMKETQSQSGGLSFGKKQPQQQEQWGS